MADPVYTTVPGLRDYLTAAGGQGRNAASLPDPDLTAALNEAEGEVTALRRLYVLPTAPEDLPDLLGAIVYGIAAYVATLQYRGSSDIAQTDPVVLRYKRAQELLARILSGQIVLPLDPPDTGAQASDDAYGYNTQPPMGLGFDVSPPTYAGWSQAGWPGGPARW